MPASKPVDAGPGPATTAAPTVPPVPATLVGGMVGAGCQPKYPVAAQRAGVQGKVELHVLVTADGVASDVTIAASSGFSLLDRAVIDAMHTCRFRPATSAGGRPTAGFADVTYKFALEN